jgi:hypothetical protein
MRLDEADVHYRALLSLNARTTHVCLKTGGAKGLIARRAEDAVTAWRQPQ